PLPATGAALLARDRGRHERPIRIAPARARHRQLNEAHHRFPIRWSLSEQGVTRGHRVVDPERLTDSHLQLGDGIDAAAENLRQCRRAGAAALGEPLACSALERRDQIDDPCEELTLHSIYLARRFLERLRGEAPEVQKLEN